MKKIIKIFVCVWILLMAVLVLTPGQSLLRIKHPSQRIETPQYSVASPSGWTVKKNDSFDGVNHQRQFTFTGWHSYSQEQYGLLPFIIFCHSTHNGYSIIEQNDDDIFNFLTYITDNSRREKIIAGKKCVVLQYRGKKSWNPNLPDQISHNEKISTTVFWHFPETGVYGYFWGFENDEKQFWQSLNTIEWKQVK